MSQCLKKNFNNPRITQSTAVLYKKSTDGTGNSTKKVPRYFSTRYCPPLAVDVVKLLLGETGAKKIQQVPLSNDTIKRCISFMSTDVKQQVIAEIRSSFMFANQQMLHHVHGTWYLFDAYIRKMLKKSFCIAILWKL